MSETDSDRQLWIFGYGSLVWRPCFEYLERRPARVRGYRRQFWQGSTDHRGVPGAPGRVVTLVPAEPESVCTGVAYRISAAAAEAVLLQLDHRERGGYARTKLELHLDGERGAPAAGLTYVATPNNPDYLGPAPLAQIAAQVLGARGPSGSNLEYVLRLADALRELGPPDPLLDELEALLRTAPTR